MEVEFYCKDARENFLDPGSVDLFITHPPIIGRVLDAYGGDSALQIQNTDSIDDFSQSLIKCLQAMEIALKDSGAILLILPNGRTLFKTIKNIIQNTSLIINRDIIWNFEKSDIVTWPVSGNEIHHILYITKNEDTRHRLTDLGTFVIDEPWERYSANEALTFDSMPKKIVETLIKVFSNEGDTVADLLAGTGTVALYALENNRKAIYNDVSSLQVDLAKKRIYDTIGYERKGHQMTKEETIAIMLETINSDNLTMGVKAGMDEKALKMQIEQSQQSLAFMLSNVYDKLKDAGALA
jgi:DNA modification methylase